MSATCNNCIDIFNRQYILKRRQSITVTQPQQEEEVGRIQQPATTTQLDLEVLKGEDIPKNSDPGDNNIAISSKI